MIILKMSLKNMRKRLKSTLTWGKLRMTEKNKNKRKMRMKSKKRTRK